MILIVNDERISLGVVYLQRVSVVNFSKEIFTESFNAEGGTSSGAANEQPRIWRLQVTCWTLSHEPPGVSAWGSVESAQHPDPSFGHHSNETRRCRHRADPLGSDSIRSGRGRSAGSTQPGKPESHGYRDDASAPGCRSGRCSDGRWCGCRRGANPAGPAGSSLELNAHPIKSSNKLSISSGSKFNCALSADFIIVHLHWLASARVFGFTNFLGEASSHQAKLFSFFFKDNAVKWKLGAA